MINIELWLYLWKEKMILSISEYFLNLLEIVQTVNNNRIDTNDDGVV